MDLGGIAALGLANLQVKDPNYALPIVAVASFVANFEYLNSRVPTAPQSQPPATPRLTAVLSVLTLCTTPLLTDVPAGVRPVRVSCWLVNSSMS